MPPSAVDANRNVRILPESKIMVAVAAAVLIFFALILGRVSSTVVLITPTNESLPFPDMEASFAPRIPGAGLMGMLYEANPLDACQPLISHPPSLKYPFLPFVVIDRGVCTFETKVENAQNAGFAAVIVYNNENNADLVTMSGNPTGIRIPAVFVSKAAGDILLKYVANLGARCYILPAFENTAWSVMAVSFISLLAVTAVLATFFFVRRHRLRHLGSRLRHAREPLSMSSREVKALPSFLFKCVEEGNATSETCVICLEDYVVSEKLRVLPCHHEFHATCIDQWLTTRRPFCPVCKRDAHMKNEDPPASESTPLLDANSRVSIPIQQTHNSVAVQVSPSGSLHTHSVESIAGSYMSSAVGSPAEVNALLSLLHTPDYCSGESPAAQHTHTIPNGIEGGSIRGSIPGESSWHSLHSTNLASPEQLLYDRLRSGPLSHSYSQLECSPASQNGLDLHNVSFPSSPSEVNSAAANPCRSSQQYRRAGSLNSLHHLSFNSCRTCQGKGDHGMDQC